MYQEITLCMLIAAQKLEKNYGNVLLNIWYLFINPYSVTAVRVMQSSTTPMLIPGTSITTPDRSPNSNLTWT